MELHYFPNSYWSRIIALLLAEKGLSFERRFVDIRKNATFDPAYLTLNPRGVVPTLVDGDKTIWDSLRIATHLDEVGGPPLYTKLGDESLVKLVDELEAVPVMLFSYSVWVKGNRGEKSADILADKVKRAYAYAEKHPERRELYERKGRYFEAFRKEVYDPEHVAEQIAIQTRYLDALGAGITDDGFVHGARYTFADAIMTAMLYRYVDLELLDHWNSDESHGLHGYYRRLNARPSFDAVFVSDPLIP